MNLIEKIANVNRGKVDQVYGKIICVSGDWRIGSALGWGSSRPSSILGSPKNLILIFISLGKTFVCGRP